MSVNVTRESIYYAQSILQVRFPDGFRHVGVAGQPLKIRTPTGWRSWPESNLPLKQRTATGWVDVVWDPTT
jgi:hypothetical protein